METENKNKELKHLGYVRIAAIEALICLSNLYEYAKQNAGPLKSTVGAVEGAVTAVVSPVYDKFRGVPDDLLTFIDNKVDAASHEFDKHAPSVAKQVVNQANSLIHEASEKAQNFVNETLTRGPRAAFNSAAIEYKQFLLTNSVKAWGKLDRYKPVHAVAEKALPVAARLSEKYNHLLKDMTVKGYPLVRFLPLVPVDEISKAFKNQSEDVKKGDEAGQRPSSDSHLD